jgi:hypothetical protein
MKNSNRKQPEDLRDKQAAAQEKKAQKAAGKEVLYRIRTPRTSDIIKAFITFTYRVIHPKVTTRMIYYGILVAIPGFLIKVMWAKILLWSLGGIMILLGFFRQYISLILTRRSDPDYKSGIEYTYDFTPGEAFYYRGDELIGTLPKYKDITGFFYDEKYYYLGGANQELLVLPRDCFTIGDPVEFEDFIYKKSKKTCKWIPDNFKDKLRKRHAMRAIGTAEMTTTSSKKKK